MVNFLLFGILLNIIFLVLHALHLLITSLRNPTTSLIKMEHLNVVFKASIKNPFYKLYIPFGSAYGLFSFYLRYIGFGGDIYDKLIHNYSNQNKGLN